MTDLIPLIDLTSLNELTDTPTTIIELTKQYQKHGCACICCYRQFISSVIQQYPTTRIATVCNFPDGNDSLQSIQEQIHQSILDGALEVDIVFPYTRFLSNPQRETVYVVNWIQQIVSIVNKIRKHVIIKIILETGMFIQSPGNTQQLLDSANLSLAAQLMVTNLRFGDFLKTSTGKRGIGATVEAARVLWNVIQSVRATKTIGLKLSGGIRTVEDARRFLKALDIDNPSPTWFRFGTSSLLDNILNNTSSSSTSSSAKY
jgi:deoxyribose-phosphate aldolase